MNSHLETWVERLVWVPATVLLMMAFTVAVMLTDNAPPVEFVPGSPYAVIEQDRVVLTYGVIRRRMCDAVVYRSVVDPVNKVDHLTSMTYTADQVRALQRVQENRISLVIPKPARIVPGVYRLQTTVLYTCNFAQHLWPIKVAFDVPYRLIPE